MSSPATRHQSPVTPHSDDEVLVRVDGVGKKFCRSLKKSLWYGVCDIGAELNPFRRRVAEVAGSGLRVAGEEEAVTGRELLVAGGAEEAVTSNESRVKTIPPQAKLPATRYLADRRSFASRRRILGG
jgi:hypothetical protein